MKTPFIIYIRAVGIYMLVTSPVIIAPIMYIISAMYVLIYGWFAWALFSLIYACTWRMKEYENRLLVLYPSVIAAVAFAFHMLGLFNPDLDVWNSGEFMLFPAAAVVAGWISLNQARKTILRECRHLRLLSKRSPGQIKTVENFE